MSITPLHSFGQAKINENNIVGFACGYGGHSSKPVEKLAKQVKAENYSNISKMLHSGKPADKFLSVITLEKLDSLGIHKITASESELINQIKKSYETVYFCSGCTFFVTRNLYELFQPMFLNESNRWLNRILIYDN